LIFSATALLSAQPSLALHYGSAIYGNIGAADRLDFTVIGPNVKLVSRIEASHNHSICHSSLATISRGRKVNDRSV
jgi:class 3 adenylate cyclase